MNTADKEDKKKRKEVTSLYNYVRGKSSSKLEKQTFNAVKMTLS